MANNLKSNVSEIVAHKFLEHFQSSRVVSMAVDTQCINGMHTASTGDTVFIKRPHQYKAVNTTDGNLTGENGNIISGHAPATVQKFASVYLNWNSFQEALELDQLDDIIRPAAEELCIDVERRLVDFMIRNSNLSYGTQGTAVDDWGDVAGAGALMDAVGVPMGGDRYYIMNPFNTVALAKTQAGLSAGSNNLIDTAWQRAQIAGNFGGLRALTSNALNTYTTGTATDRAGVLASSPDVTYATHKDSMRQQLAVSGFTGNATIKAGEIITITGPSRVNVRNGNTIINGSGAKEAFKAIVAQDVTTSSSGTATIVISGPAIYESGGAYNTVDKAPVSGDVITITGSQGTTYQPNLFFHKQAFALASVKLPKLYDTDTIATTKDGMSIRITKFSDGVKGLNQIRFDLLPAFGRLNPFFSGQGFGA